MFEHFTFGTLPQPHTCPSAAVDDDLHASPLDTSLPPPVFPTQSSCPSPKSSNSPQRGINDMVTRFTNHSLAPEDEISRPSSWQNSLPPTPIIEYDPTPDPFTGQELSYRSARRGRTMRRSRRGSSPSPYRSSSPSQTLPSKRAQRQINVQKQSCSSHLRDIHTLVENMIASNSQCNLRKSASLSYLSSPLTRDILIPDIPEYPDGELVPDDDEGFDEMDDPHQFLRQASLILREVSLRRAGTPSGVQKHNGLRYRASAECLGGNGPGLTPNGRVKVRCLPRMRKRPTVPPG
ncbi:uncharacterized protein BP5553_03336 [Venustampulla echinocandica]|uniref:Uncharacterized protein n=1 Tax=Venustampulla echinocandica TaxID=2656787 RepID=A0A370TTZ2_9HELO|nr:uncharacterized protein BP5553_03336 [Venustampulla echinocandica]RDL38996.1 hypothetical protein BP5553_03336 [Venustampulla echinocandica]